MFGNCDRLKGREMLVYSEGCWCKMKVRNRENCTCRSFTLTNWESCDTRPLDVSSPGLNSASHCSAENDLDLLQTFQKDFPGCTVGNDWGREGAGKKIFQTKEDNVCGTQDITQRLREGILNESVCQKLINLFGTVNQRVMKCHYRVIL